VTDEEYRYLFHWGLTAAGTLLLLVWGTVAYLLDKRSRKNSIR
jgi:hypothetical protein